MLYSIRNREDLEKLEELASLQDQIKIVRLQDKLGKQNFHEDMKKIFEPVTKTLVVRAPPDILLRVRILI